MFGCIMLLICDISMHAACIQPLPLTFAKFHVSHPHIERDIEMYAESLSVIRDLPKPEGRWELVEVIGKTNDSFSMMEAMDM